MEYSEQTRKLLGLSHTQLPLSDYLALGISSEHVNELIHMATNPKLLDAEEDPVFWAAVHAWYALGQLKATEAIGPLLDLMEKYPYDRLFDVYLPKVFVLMGEGAIPVLRDYLWDTSRFEDSRGFTFHCLDQLGLIYRQPCLEVVVEFLQRFDKDSKVLNSFAMCSLIELEAVEYITIIREAFQQDCVDIDIPGDLEDVEIDLGLRAKRDTPQPHYNYQSPGMLQQFDAYRQNREYDAYPDDYMESEPVRLPPKVGRNDPCPCGSGKKFKKCCLH